MPKRTIAIEHNEFETPPEVGGGGVFGMFVILSGLFASFVYGGFVITTYVWEVVFG